MYAELTRRVLTQFELDHRGIHGTPHWMRVRQLGLNLAAEEGGNPHVVNLFALFHDSRRLNEHTDHGHGGRGAQLARLWHQQGHFAATTGEMDMLMEACYGHSDGETSPASVTVACCWDADRLDLGRVGTRPNPRYLCTAFGKRAEVIEAAWQRSNAWAKSYYDRH